MKLLNKCKVFGIFLRIFRNICGFSSTILNFLQDAEFRVFVFTHMKYPENIQLFKVDNRNAGKNFVKLEIRILL